jgi:hypothetical protein
MAVQSLWVFFALTALGPIHQPSLKKTVDAQTHFVVEEVPVHVCSLEGGARAPHSVSPKGVPKPHEYWNLPWHRQLSFCFIAYFPVCTKEIFLWECGNV